MKREVTYFVVEGYGTFPHDMLRYDSAWPTDQESLDNMMMKPSEPEHRQVRRVALGCANGAPNPTESRWDSFFWKVVGRSSAPIPYGTQMERDKGANVNWRNVRPRKKNNPPDWEPTNGFIAADGVEFG